MPGLPSHWPRPMRDEQQLVGVMTLAGVDHLRLSEHRSVLVFI
ncbi:hypothetical protein [Pseudomonas sp.]